MEDWSPRSKSSSPLSLSRAHTQLSLYSPPQDPKVTKINPKSCIKGPPTKTPSTNQNMTHVKNNSVGPPFVRTSKKCSSGQTPEKGLPRPRLLGHGPRTLKSLGSSGPAKNARPDQKPPDLQKHQNSSGPAKNARPDDSREK